MKPYKMTSRSPSATETEGWSGVMEHEMPSTAAAIAWFAFVAITQPEVTHIIETPDGHVLAVYEPQ